MLYVSFIVSLLMLFFVVRLTLVQRRFDWLNGLMIVCALAGVILHIDAIATGRVHQSASILSFSVFITWLISSLRARRT